MAVDAVEVLSTILSEINTMDQVREYETQLADVEALLQDLTTLLSVSSPISLNYSQLQRNPSRLRLLRPLRYHRQADQAADFSETWNNPNDNVHADVFETIDIGE
jgi:hypothetical protein